MQQDDWTVVAIMVSTIGLMFVSWHVQTAYLQAGCRLRRILASINGKLHILMIPIFVMGYFVLAFVYLFAYYIACAVAEKWYGDEIQASSKHLAE